MVMAQLVDQYGRPIDLAALKREKSAPTLSGVRPIVGGHPAQGLTPGRLANLLKESEHGDTTRLMELAEEMEEKDLHYLSVLGTRKRAVAQLDITVEPGGESAREEEIAKFVLDWLTRDEVEDEIIDILDAIGKGFSVTEIIWETSAKQWLPARLEWRMQQWFEFDRVTGRKLLLRGNGEPQPLEPFAYIAHFAKAKSGLPIRGGLARIAAWSYLFKNYDLKDWVTFLEVYGMPIRVGRYENGASEDDKETLLRAVASIGTDAAAIMPKTMMVEFVENKAGGGSGSEQYERFADWLDRQVSKGVLGQTLTTEVQSGSMAAAKVHDEVRRDIMRSDAQQVSATLNRDLVRPIVDLNFGPQDTYPRIRMEIPDSVDLKNLAEALAPMVDRGLQIPQGWVRERFGAPAPAEGEDVLAPDTSSTLPASDPGSTGQGDLSGGGRELATIRASQAAADVDASIDSLSETALEDWEEILDPLIDPLMADIENADDLSALRDQLTARLQDMDTDTFQELLARAGFSARIAGAVGALDADD
jgi:phage gp29-like protein